MSIKNHKNLQEKPDRASMFWRERSLPDKNVCCSTMVGLMCQEIPQKVLSTDTRFHNYCIMLKIVRFLEYLQFSERVRKPCVQLNDYETDPYIL